MVAEALITCAVLAADQINKNKEKGKI